VNSFLETGARVPPYAFPTVSEEADAQEFLSALLSLNSQSGPIENKVSEQVTEQCSKPVLQDDLGSSKQDDNECEEFESIMHTICHQQEFEAKGTENEDASKGCHNGFQHEDFPECTDDLQWTLATIGASAQKMERQITVETAKSSTESSVALDEAVANEDSEVEDVSYPYILVDGLPHNTPVRSRLPSPRTEHMTPSPFSETISACIEEVERRNEFLLFLSSQSRILPEAQLFDQHQVSGRPAGSDCMPHLQQTNGIEEFRQYASKQNPSLQRNGNADGTAGDEIVTLRKELHALRDRCLCWQAFQNTATPL